MAPLEDLRRRFDRFADAVPAHVTLVFPFERTGGEEALLEHIKRAVSGVPAFELELNAVTCSPDHNLFLLVDLGGDKVRELHARLYTGVLRPLLSDRPFTPHVTVGRFAVANDCARAMKVIEPMNLRVRTTAEALRIYDLSRTPYPVSAEIQLA